MRRRFILCFFASMCICSLHAQQTTSDSLRAKVDTLEKQLSESNYTRIPNKDFDNLLAQKVDEKVSDEVQSIIKWIALFEGLIVLILGFLAKYYFNDLIRKEFLKTSLKLEDNIKSSIDKRLVDTVSVIWDDGATNLIRRARELNYQDESIINSISHFLETENLKLEQEVKLDLIAALVKCYFYSKKKDKIERLIQIITKYEDEKLKLRPETYADAAIVFCDNYEFYGTANYMNASLDYCDKSINTLPDYGTPYAVKFEVYMINYSKAYNNTESANALENVRKIFKSISNNKSDVVCAETIVRFFGDKKVYLKEYLEELEKQFPQEIKYMKQRAFNYLSRNPQDLANANTNELFESLKTEGFVATA